MLKLVLVERESGALDQWLSARTDRTLASSDLARVEVRQGCRRGDARQLPEAEALLDALDLLPLTSALLDDSGHLDHRGLRSLDAIHLASALSIREDLSAFVAYDVRLAEAATAAGLAVVAPGA